jgi:hypothetical protein
MSPWPEVGGGGGYERLGLKKIPPRPAWIGSETQGTSRS